MVYSKEELLGMKDSKLIKLLEKMNISPEIIFGEPELVFCQDANDLNLVYGRKKYSKFGLKLFEKIPTPIYVFDSNIENRI